MSRSELVIKSSAATSHWFATTTTHCGFEVIKSDLNVTVGKLRNLILTSSMFKLSNALHTQCNCIHVMYLERSCWEGFLLSIFCQVNLCHHRQRMRILVFRSSCFCNRVNRYVDKLLFCLVQIESMLIWIKSLDSPIFHIIFYFQIGMNLLPDVIKFKLFFKMTQWGKVSFLWIIVHFHSDWYSSHRMYFLSFSVKSFTFWMPRRFLVALYSLTWT